MTEVKTPPAFEINRPRPDGKPIARLPTLGLTYDGPLSASAQFRIQGVDDYVGALHAGIDGAVRVSREIEGSIVEAAKALGATPPQAMAYARLSFMPDPANYGLMQWPGIQPESLRKIAQDNIAPQMIIRSRVSDLRRYSGLSTHPWKPGWEITLRDPDETPSAKQREDVKAAQQFLLNCSREGVYIDPQDRDAHQIAPFATFLCGMVNDTLTFDGWSVWTDRDRVGRVRSFANLPAGLVRLAMPKQGFRGDPRVYAALVDETGTPVAAFTRDDMTWKVRNVRTDPAVIGYGYSEVEICVRLIQAFQAAVDLNADTFCYSEDTEVLTRDGWKLFGDTDISCDEFATLNTLNSQLEYQKATDKVWKDYEGDMYALSSRSVDLAVTPNHRVVVRYRPDFLTGRNSGYTVYRADDMYAKMQGMTKSSRNNYCLPMVSVWEGVEIGPQEFVSNPPQYTSATSRTISGDDYCAFMGMYLSEGNLTTQKGDKPGVKTRIDIHQRNYSKGYEPFKTLLTHILGHEPGYTADRFWLGWRGMAEHLSAFGSNCYSKRIPQTILNATPRQQAIFWDYYMLGDGSESPSGRQHIATTSRIMADQLQELAQKMGFAATVHTVDASKNDMPINGHAVKSRAVRYDVYLKQSVMQSFDMEKGRYKGKIGCVSVPNGTLYVRRNGKAAWCGNTRNGIPNGIMKLKGDFWQQEQVDALMREWTNMKRGVSKMWGMPVVAVPEDGDIEIMDFMDMKGYDVRYKDHMNMMMGCACVVYQYPVRRLGMFVSGHGKDNQPVPDESVEQAGVDDPGLPALLQFIEEAVNEYLLWPAWPHLQFGFKNKNPKEDARSYAELTKARTWKESRAAVDLSSLASTAPKWLKPMAEILELCPEDPSKVSAFQTMAVKMLESKVGELGSPDEASPGAPFPSLKDPAKTQEHGHRVGVRRNSAAEEAHADA